MKNSPREEFQKSAVRFGAAEAVPARSSRRLPAKILPKDLSGVYSQTPRS